MSFEIMTGAIVVVACFSRCIFALKLILGLLISILLIIAPICHSHHFFLPPSCFLYYSYSVVKAIICYWWAKQKKVLNPAHVLRLVVCRLQYWMSSLKVAICAKSVIPLDTVIVLAIVCPPARANYKPFYNFLIKRYMGSVGSYGPIIFTAFPQGQFCLFPCRS